MRSMRKRSADHLESEGRTTKRHKRPKKSGVPKLGLWECGIGSVLRSCCWCWPVVWWLGPVPGAHADVCDLGGAGSSGVVRAAVMAKGRAPS